MPSARDFVLAQCQATLFTPDSELSTVRLFSRLLPRWVERFDGEPIVLPLPDAIPKDVPRAVFQSRSGEWRCEFASGRVNLFWRQPPRSSTSQTIDHVYTVFMPLLAEYVTFLDSRVGRFAAVVNRYIEHGEPAKYLATHFCRDRWLSAPFNRPESFELHAHKTFTLSGRFKVNSWVRNKTGKLTTDGAERAIVIVEQDLNTLAEEQESQAFSVDDLGRFFEASRAAFDEILNLYYPSD
jgi:hypothetical protein